VTPSPRTPATAGLDAIFFDLDVLLTRDRAGWRVPRDASPALAEAATRRDMGTVRLGVLGEGHTGSRREHVMGMLEFAGIDGLFDDDLVVLPFELGASLTDPRAFAVAAAVAGLPPDQCTYVGVVAARLAAARDAGFAVRPVEGARQARASRATAAPASTFGGPFPAGEIDEDIGPRFVLRGRIVTMDSDHRVLDGGRLAIDQGRIAAVVASGKPLPTAFAQSPEIDTRATIYPGLIDLHNHYVYNVLPFWPILKRWDNRTKWMGDRGYQADVSLPINVLADSLRASRWIVRYVEAKAIIGGTTSGQGVRTQVRGGVKMFRGAMRNAEETNDARLPEAGTLVPNLGRRPEDFAAFRASVQKRAAAGGAYFYHLAEGTNPLARRTYTDLRDNACIAKGLAGIHGLGLEGEDFRVVADRAGAIVWSPFSNMLLYGETVDIGELADSGVVFSIGSDWAPTGSKNLLQELKVARFENARQGSGLSLRDLVGAVTTAPARILGWERHVGVIRRSALADVIAIRGDTGDPYELLVDAVERDIRLVVTHGFPRYGDRSLMQALVAEEDGLERWRLGTADKAFAFGAPQSGLDDLSFADAKRQLEEAMSDLPAFRATLPQERLQARAAAANPDALFRIALDNEPTFVGPDGAARSAPMPADWSRLPRSVELDEPYVGGGTYWARMDRQTNISSGLKEALRASYPDV
jgi:5-methylthioadenosine/S-adenosylhomocysteine deaminase